MSDADRVNLSYSQEATFGSDAGMGTKKAIRFTGESLKQTTNSTPSAEIRPDRQTSDILRTGISAEGDINIEYQTESYDDFLEAALQSVGWSTPQTINDTVYAADSVGNKFTDSGSGFITDGFVAGMLLRVSGFTDPSNNSFARVLSVDAGEMAVDMMTLVTEAAGASITFIQLSEITNGITRRSFGIEREYTDLTNEFAYYNGMELGTMNMSLASDAIITGALGFMGIKEESRATATNGPTPDKTENGVLSSVDDIDGIFRDGVAECVQALTIDINNNLRSRKCIGILETDSIRSGQFIVSGTFQKYYESKALIDQYLDFDDADLAYVIQDSEGNAYVVWMPRVKYSSGQRPAGGQNSDIVTDMAFTAFRDEVHGFTLKIARFSAVVVPPAP